MGLPILLFALVKIAPGPTIAIVSFFKYTFSPTYMDTKEINQGSVGYVCTQQIKVKKSFEKVGHMGGTAYELLYNPVNLIDFNKYCKMSWIE